MINTGMETIPPNSCICWDFPDKVEANNGLDGQKIKGPPSGAIYPLIKVYDITNIATRCVGKTKDQIQ